MKYSDLPEADRHVFPEDDSMVLADLIMKYPKLHSTFLFEEWLYNDKDVL